MDFFVVNISPQVANIRENKLYRTLQLRKCPVIVNNRINVTIGLLKIQSVTYTCRLYSIYL